MVEHGVSYNAETNSDEIIKSLKRWMVQAAREFHCTNEDVAYIVYDYITEAVPSGKY